MLVSYNHSTSRTEQILFLDASGLNHLNLTF